MVRRQTSNILAPLAIIIIILSAHLLGSAALPKCPYRTNSHATSNSPNKGLHHSGGHDGDDSQHAGKDSGVTRYFDQWIDHVDGALSDTFKPRYFINTTFFTWNSSTDKAKHVTHNNREANATADVATATADVATATANVATATIPKVFCCVGGEGPPLTENVVITGEYHCALMVTLAAAHGALIVALEHRYYGESVPTPDLSTENMRFCESHSLCVYALL